MDGHGVRGQLDPGGNKRWEVLQWPIHLFRNEKQSGASHISQSLVGPLLGTKWQPAS